MSRLRALACAVLLLCGAGWELPTRPDGDVAAGNRAFRAGDYERALAAYRRALAGDGDRSRLHFDLGAALYELATRAEGDGAAALYEQAETAFRRAAESRDPDLAALAYYNLGNVHFRRGRYDEAISAYRVVLRLDPENDDARHNLELALRRRAEMPPSGQGGAAQPSAPQAGQPGQAPQPGQGEGGEAPDAPAGQGAGQPGGSPAQPEAPEPEPEPQSPPPEQPGGEPEPGQGKGGEPAPSASFSGSGDIERKLRALERRSRELRRERLRSGSRASEERRLQHGKDW